MKSEQTPPPACVRQPSLAVGARPTARGRQTGRPDPPRMCCKRILLLMICALWTCLAARAVDTVTEPEKCLFRGAPYQYAYLEKEDLLLTANNGGVYVYDVASGEQRWHRYLVSPRGYQGVSFGRRQVLGWSDQGVFLVDAATGKETWWRRDTQHGEVYQAVLSPDESRVLMVCERGSILYGVADRTQRVLPTMQGFRGWFPDGKTVMLESYEGGNDNPVHKWKTMDIDSGAITPCWEEPYSWDVPSPSFSSLGQFAELTGDEDDKTTLKISDARTHTTLREFKDLGDLDRYAFWMRDGKRLVCTASDHKTLRVIDAETGAEQLTLSREGHRFGVGAVFEDETGAAWIFSRDSANHRYVWNLAPDGAPRKVLDGSRIAPAHFYYDLSASRRLVSINTEESLLRIYSVYSLDGANKLAEWRCRTPKHMYGGFTVNKALTHVAGSCPIKRSEYGRPQNMTFNLYTHDRETPVRTGPGNILAMSPDARWLALQTDDKVACLYDTQTDRIVDQYAVSDKQETRRSMNAAFSDDGKRVAVNTTETVEVTDLSEGYSRRAMAISKDKGLWWLTMCFSPDGNHLLCGGNNSAWMFDAASGALLHTFTETERFAEQYQYQNGGFWNSLANVAKDWAGVVTDRFKRDSQLAAVFTEDGNRVITQMSGQIIRIWNAKSGKMLHTIHTGLPEKRNPRGEIRNSITLSANGRFAFASNLDAYGPAGLWSLTDGTLLRKYQIPQSSWIFCVPQDDGKAVFVLSNGDLYRWPGAPQELLDQLPIVDKQSPL